MELYLLIILALSLYSEAIPIKDLGIPGTVNDKKVQIIMILDVVNITAECIAPRVIAVNYNECVLDRSPNQA